MSDDDVKTILGEEKAFYEDMAKVFCVNPNDESLKTQHVVNWDTFTWLNAEHRGKAKNVWAIIKDILMKISKDEDITNKKEHKYQRITISQIMLFSALIGLRRRMPDPASKQDDRAQRFFHTDLDIFALALECLEVQNSIIYR